MTIEAQRLFNFEIKDRENRESLRSNRSNDISASSETGTSGTVALEILNVDPSRGLTELPVDLTDPGDRISQGCRASSDRSRFVNSGRNGIPTGPDAPLRGALGSPASWITLGDVMSQQVEAIASPVVLTAIEAQSVEHITEAQHWQQNQSGQVQLVAERDAVGGPTLVSHHIASAAPVALNCQGVPRGAASSDGPGNGSSDRPDFKWSDFKSLGQP